MNEKYILRMHPGSFRHTLPLPVVTGATLAFWALSIVIEGFIQTGRIPRPLSAGLEFVPGLLGLAVLFAAGFRADDCYLQYAPLSRKGMIALLITLPLLLPVYLVGTWNGWNWINVLLYGPAGALAQVLFFRCTLLPVSLRVFKARLSLAIVLAALLHGLWHVGPIVQGAPWYGALPVMMVPFLAGIAWNWQIQHDRTVLWAAILHIFVDQGIILLFG